MNVLLLEDDFLYASTIKEYLESLDFNVYTASDGDSACELIAKVFFHLFILDVKVPNASGFEVLSYIKKLDLKSPVMMMTSLSDILSISTAYELGCSEYLKKPFELDELKYRIMQLLKNHFNLESIKIKDYSYDLKNKILKHQNKQIELTQIEQIILEHLLINKERFSSTEELLGLLENDYDESYVRVYIKRLRAKISDDFISSKRGFGYKINA